MTMQKVYQKDIEILTLWHGFKERNFIKTIKHLIRQFKRTMIWSLKDIFKFRFKIVYVNFVIFYYFCKIDFKYMKKNK